MANLAWYPIDPTLNEGGAFSAFSYEENGSEIKPVPLHETENPFSQFRVLQDSYNSQIAASLGFGVGSVNGDFNSFVLSYEAMIFSEKIVETPIGGKIYGTRWGAGLRVMLKVTEIKSSLNLNFGAMAANAELGLAKVSYEINGIGITKPDILAVLPGPSSFNYQNYQKILDASDKVKKYMSTNSNELVAKPFQIFISDDQNKDIFNDSRSILYGMRNIVDRNTLKNAIQDSQDKYNISTIKAVYSKFNILDENFQPTREQKKEAEDFLKT